MKDKKYIPNGIKDFEIRQAEEKDVSIILDFIKQLAVYEKLIHEVIATEELLKEYLFGDIRYAEVVIAYYRKIPVGYALFFHNFSTFMGQPGIYLEDLFVQPEYRGKGFGKALLSYVARLAVERNCKKLEWAVLDWNEPAIEFYESLGADLKREWLLTRMTGESLEKLAQEI